MPRNPLISIFSSFVIAIANYASAEPASSFDVDTLVLNAPCVDILSNGAAAGENGSRLSYSLDMTLSGSKLLASNVVEISAAGNCSASFDAVTEVYFDVVTVGTDEVELTLSYSGGVEFAPTAVVFRNNLSDGDLSVIAGSSAGLQLPAEIISADAVLKLANGAVAPAFISIENSELNVAPDVADIGDYPLRIEWADQVEFITLHVLDDPANLITLSQQPAALPDFNSLKLYSRESFFNLPLPESPSVDPNSALLLKGLIQSQQFVVQAGQFSAPVFFADSSTPLSSVQLPCGEVWELGISSINATPIPAWAIPSDDVDGDSLLPSGCGEESGRDDFMILLDLENRCEYDFWQTRTESGDWVASFATAFDMDGPGVHPKGLSARGSGFAFLGGIIWPSELADGEIRHPLAFSYEFPKANGPVAPATDSDGISTEPFALPEGARIQLDPSLDLDSLNLTDYEKVIARAMQVYGLVLVDRGGSGPAGLYAIDPSSVSDNPYTSIWGEDDFVALENIRIADLPFRVLELPVQNTTWRDDLNLGSNRCVNYQ